MNRRGAPSPPPPSIPTRVELTRGDRQVIVESGDSLPTVRAAAEELWKGLDTNQPSSTPLGFSAADLTSEPVQSALMPPEINLPQRLIIPGQETPDDRRTN